MSSPTPLDERTHELIHLVVDGAASPAQKQELAETLGSSPEARAAFESMQATVRALEAIPLEEAPSSLKDRILHEARGSFQVGAPSRVAPFSRRRWILGAAWGAAAAGLLTYVVAFHGPGSPDRFSAPQASGAMLDLDTRTWPLVSQLAAQDLEGAPTALIVRRKGDRILLQTDLRQGRAKPLALKWDDRQFVLLEAPSGQGLLPIGAGSHELTIPPGAAGPVSLVLGPREGAAGPGAVSLSQEGREIIQTTVQIR